jgi:hypothetical protein
MDRRALRTRLRETNIEHSALLKDKSGEGHLARLAQLRIERVTLMRLLSGDGTLRLVVEQDQMPAAYRQSA